jgi:hypothetical protein
MGNRFVQEKAPPATLLQGGDEWFPPKDMPFFHKVWTGGSSGWSTGALATYPEDIESTKTNEEELAQKKEEQQKKRQEDEKKKEEERKKRSEEDKKKEVEKQKQKEEDAKNQKKKSEEQQEEDKKRAEAGEAPRGARFPGEPPMTPEESGASGISEGSRKPSAQGPLGLGDVAAEQQTKPLNEPDPVETEVVEDDEEETDDDDETEASDSDGDDEGTGGEPGSPRSKRKLIRKRGKSR